MAVKPLNMMQDKCPKLQRIESCIYNHETLFIEKIPSRSLTFVGPCIVIFFYSKTNQMQNISNLFYFGITLNMFRTVSPSIIRSRRLYIHQVYVIQVLWLFASKQSQNLYDIYLILYAQSSTPNDGRRDRPKHVECSEIK
jgi:hypothetical protein